MESQRRSDELTARAQSFLEYKQKWDSQIVESNYTQNKAKILFHLKASEENWRSWTWQISNRITDVHTLTQILNLKPGMAEDIELVSKKYRWSISPYYLSLIQNVDYSDPILKQCIPAIQELDCWGESDPMNEAMTNPAGAITRRYPDRAIINVTNRCFMFCRHCQRRRNIGENDYAIHQKLWKESLAYLYAHPEIRDVLITGGDPLSLGDSDIDSYLTQLREIPSVEIVRIGTRAPVSMPSRITSSLLKVIQKHAPIYINTQFNHPAEITDEAKNACLALNKSGAILGNQMVLLKGVNDDAFTIRLLNQQLLQCGVRPYYIFHPKKVIGTRHFYVSVEKGLGLVEDLYGNTSGLAIPAYIYNADKGLGKIRLHPSMLKHSQNHHIILNTWESKEIKINITEDGTP